MDNQNSKTQTKPQFSPYQEGVKKALKQAGETHTMEALQQGVPAQHIEQQSGLSQQDILAQLLELSKTQVAAKPPAGEGTGLMSGRVGLIGGLLNGVQGNGFNPMAQKTQSLGFDNAAQVMGLQQTMNKNSLDAQKAPLEMDALRGEAAQAPLKTEKLKTDTAQSKVNLRQSDPGFKVQQAQREASAKELATYVPKAVRAARGLQKLEQVATELGDFEEGFYKQMGARTEAATKAFAKSPEYVRFNAVVNQELANLARFGGETGALATEDINRWKDALTSTTTPLATKLKTLGELKEDLKIYSQSQFELAGMSSDAAPTLKGLLETKSQTSKVGESGGTPPPRSSAPKGATGWSKSKQTWVFGNGKQ